MTSKRTVYRKAKPMGMKAMCCLGSVALLVPTFSVYLGYWIGEYAAPYKNILPDRNVVIDPSNLNMSHYRKHNLTIEFSGGLGSQMFQYAALYGLSKASGLQPTITSDIRTARIVEVFPFLQAHKSDTTRPGSYFLKFREHKSHAFDLRAFSLNYMKDIELIGEYKSYRYFDHVRAEVRQQFSFSQTAIGLVQEFLHESLVKAQNIVFEEGKFGEDLTRFPITYVGIHVRRGDILTEENRKLGYRPADVNYIYAAMHYFRHKYKNVIFIVTSDDLEWCKGHIEAPTSVVMFSRFKHEGLDMCLLTQCNHTIMTTGSFGWWAGWLSGGTVLYFKDNPIPKSELANEFKTLDYFPNHWLPVMA